MGKPFNWGFWQWRHSAEAAFKYLTFLSHHFNARCTGPTASLRCLGLITGPRVPRGWLDWSLDCSITRREVLGTLPNQSCSISLLIYIIKQEFHKCDSVSSLISSTNRDYVLPLDLGVVKQALHKSPGREGNDMLQFYYPFLFDSFAVGNTRTHNLLLTNILHCITGIKNKNGTALNCNPELQIANR